MITFLLHLLLVSLNLQSTIGAHCSTITSTKTFQKCMTLPTQQASLAWTFHPHNSTLDLAFFGSFISPSGWVAWGLNPVSPEMTGTRALLAFPDPNSGKLLLLPYILDSSVKLQKSPLLSRPLNDRHDDHRVISSSAALYGGKMATVHDGASVQIFATIKLNNPNKTKLHHVWNRGLYVQGYSPTIHPTTSTDLSSAATVDHLAGDADRGSVPVAGADLKTVHAVLNAVSWGVLLPAGAVAARYLRHFSSLGPAWFYAHAGVQLTGFLLGTAGFAVGLRLGEMSPGVTRGLHRKLGFAVVFLAALQTAALLFRPRTTNKFRKYWKSYHHFVGYACVVIGVVNVFQGFEVMGASGSYAKLAYCLSLSTILGACVALEVNAWVVFCRRSKEDKMRREGLISNIGGSDKGNSGIILN